MDGGTTSGVTPRRPGEAVAERMVDVAVERIVREGMTVGLGSVSMEAVIKEAGVSRASAYRRWPRREDFLAEVLVATVRRTTLIPETPEDVELLLALVRSRTTGLVDAQARRDLVVEGLRLTVDLDLRRILASPRWRTFVALSATYQGLPAGPLRDQVGAALVETEQAFADRRAAIYADLARLLGYRLAHLPRGPEGFRMMAGAAGALVTGLMVRATPDPGWLDRRTPARLYGSSEEMPWSEPERHAVGVLLAHLEPDPDVEWDDEAVRERFAALTAQAAEMFALPAPHQGRLES